MKTIFSFLAISLLSMHTYSQCTAVAGNLVQNCSFEIGSVPTSGHQLDRATNWGEPWGDANLKVQGLTVGGKGLGYCPGGTNYWNWYECASASDGSRAAGVYNSNSAGNNREMIEAFLSGPGIEAGGIYQVEFDYMNPCYGNVAAGGTASHIGVLIPRGQITDGSFNGATILDNASTWTDSSWTIVYETTAVTDNNYRTFSATFTATYSAPTMIIGQIMTAADWTTLGGNTNYNVIDNVSLVKIATLADENIQISGRAIENNNIKVNWEVSNLEPGAKYDLYRSVDGGKSFYKISSTYYNGDFNYEYIDGNVRSSEVYYKVKEQATDGTHRYSKPTFVKIEQNNGQEIDFSLLNANTDRINLDVNSVENRESLILLTDMNGRVVYSKNTELQKGVNKIELNLNQVSAGMYVISIAGKAKKKVVLN